METDAFYDQLIANVLNLDFMPNVDQFTEEKLNVAGTKADRMMMKAAEILTQHAAHTKQKFAKIQGVFDREGVDRELERLHALTPFAFFKYDLAQPIVLVVIEADALKVADFQRITKELVEATLRFIPMTGKIKNVKLGVFLMAIYVFTNAKKADSFAEKVQKSCKVWKFWKKSWVVPWAIDAQTTTLRKHKGLPILTPSLLDAKKLMAGF